MQCFLHHSTIVVFCGFNTVSMKVREIGCAGANQGNRTVCWQCLFTQSDVEWKGNHCGILECGCYGNRDLCRRISITNQSPFPHNIAITTASPNSPLEISIVSFSWSIMSPIHILAYRISKTLCFTSTDYLVSSNRISAEISDIA